MPRRALDYAETRPDIDAARLSYYGLSWGGRIGPITLALDPRIKAGVLLMGGLAANKSAPEADPFTFAPRVRIPVLMLNGDQDFIFPPSDLAAAPVRGIGHAERGQEARALSRRARESS